MVDYLWDLIEETALESDVLGADGGSHDERRSLSIHVRTILAERGYCNSLGTDRRDGLVKSDTDKLSEVPSLDLLKLRADVGDAVLSFSDALKKASLPE